MSCERKGGFASVPQTSYLFLDIEIRQIFTSFVGLHYRAR